MPYSICFVNKSNLYVEVGFNSKRKAKVKLEEIANCFVDSSNAIGEIWYRNDYVEKVTHYEISYKGGKACLTYKRSKKTFNQKGL